MREMSSVVVNIFCVFPIRNAFKPNKFQHRKFSKPNLTLFVYHFCGSWRIECYIRGQKNGAKRERGFFATKISSNNVARLTTTQPSEGQKQNSN